MKVGLHLSMIFLGESSVTSSAPMNEQPSALARLASGHTELMWSTQEVLI